MLMMFALRARLLKEVATDAHDARFGAPDSSRTVTADARDAPFGGLPPEQSQAADAHDARFGCPILEGHKQLMLMMLSLLWGPSRTVTPDAHDVCFAAPDS